MILQAELAQIWYVNKKISTKLHYIIAELSSEWFGVWRGFEDSYDEDSQERLMEVCWHNFYKQPLSWAFLMLEIFYKFSVNDV